MIYVQINNKYKNDINQEILFNAAKAVKSYLNIQESISLTIAIEDDNKLIKLNLAYRGINKATDVLSFESNIVDPETGNTYLGDVIISFDSALSQASSHHHDVHDELQLLVIHGILHLLGYDHGTQDDKLEMWEIQTKILAQIGSEFNNHIE